MLVTNDLRQVAKGEETANAWMATAQLSAVERMALVAGSVVKAIVVADDARGLRLALPSESRPRSQGKDAVSPSPDAVSRHPKRRSAVMGLKDVPVGAFLLNNLKTGQRLEGRVVHSTPQAAFVAANVFRRAKGGVVAEVSGLLRKADVPRDLLSTSRRLSGQGPLMEKGSRVAVYVKEVFKNAGYVSAAASATTRLTVDCSKARVLHHRPQSHP